MPRLDRLAVAVTFFFNKERLHFLQKTCSNLKSMANSVTVDILTNTADEEEIDAIRSTLKTLDLELSIHTPSLLGHPYLLPWAHFAIFRKLLSEPCAYSHFVYLEDDIYLTVENIEYWLEGYGHLKQFGAYPSFVRYEINPTDGRIYPNDFVQHIVFSEQSKIFVGKKYCYMSLPNPYQGMYFLDRQMMEEHLNGDSSSPDFGKWDIRAKAAQGLTFSNIPPKFSSRNLAGCDPETLLLDKRALIHHLPNNYTVNPDLLFGKIRLEDLLIS